MCKKKQFKYCPSEIDKCMIKIIKFLNELDVDILACCCGHKKYHMTIIIKVNVGSFLNSKGCKDFKRDLFSGIIMTRKRNFYKKDKQGYYFIPEVEEYWRNKNAKM